MDKLTRALIMTILADEEESELKEMAEHRHDKHRSYDGGYVHHEKDDHYEKPEHKKLTHEAAVNWVTGMYNADGSRGAHWTMEQTTKLLEDRGLTFEPTDWWVAMNMVWSDYCKVGDKHGVGTIDFYADMAVAFLHDQDAVDGKLGKYYWHIVEK